MKLNIPDNVKEIHFYKENLNFPIVMYICTCWEK